MYNRNGQSEDPRVCVQGWANECVYLEGSSSTVQEQLNKGGANVFVRNSKTNGWYSFQIYFLNSNKTSFALFLSQLNHRLFSMIRLF